MVSPDPFDEFDDLFADPSNLDAIDAILQSTQAPPKPRVTQPYHHQIARPRNVATQKTFSRRKEPAPLNTEPRAGPSGFGWEHGGKRSIPGNVERHVNAIHERQKYWALDEKAQEEESYPELVVNAAGQYGFSGEEEGEGEVVDTFARTGELGESQAKVRDTTGAAARREAIMKAANEATAAKVVPRPPISRSNSAAVTRPGPSNLQAHVQAAQTTFQAQPQANFPTRSISRSVSAGAHLSSRPSSRASQILPPISSQNFSSPIPLSQGSARRKAAIELDEEQRKQEAAEAELLESRPRPEADETMGKGNEREEKQEVMEGKKDNKEWEEMERQLNEMRKQVKTLQEESWRVEGEKETMRRVRKDVSRGHPE